MNTRVAKHLLVALLCLGTGCSSTVPGPLIDMHTHVTFPSLGESPDALGTQTPATVDALLAAMNAAHVSKAGVITIAQRGDLEATRRRNDALVALTKAHPQLFAIGSVHPMDGAAAMAELGRIKAAGVRAIKLHPNTQRFDLGASEVSAVVAEAARLGLPILIDGYNPLDANQTGKLLMLAAKNPSAKIIMAHMGGPRWSESAVFGLVRKFRWFPRNVWVDVSAIVTLYADSPYAAQLVWVLRQIGMDRVLFGSDFPVDSPVAARKALERLGLTPSELAKVSHTNSRELFGLVPAP